MREIKANGVLDEIHAVWLGDEEEKRAAPDLESLPAPNGRLRMAADTTMLPFIFIRDGAPVGIDMDIAYRFCLEYGYGLELMAMDFSGLLPAIVSGKCDFAFGGISYTPERAESVYYAEHTFEGRSVIAVLKRSGSSGKGFLASLAESFEKTFLRSFPAPKAAMNA